MRIEVVRDIGRLPSPRLERVQLVLRLGHVGVHVLKVPKSRASTITSIGVEGVKSLVDFNANQNILLRRQLCELDVMFQRLDDGLGNHHVHALLDALQGNVKVGIVRREDDGDVASLEGRRGLDVGGRVDLGVRGEGFAGEIHIVVDLLDATLHMSPNSWEFLALRGYIRKIESQSEWLSTSEET